MTGTENLAIRQDAAGTILPVKVVPGASRDKVVGVLGDALKVTVSAAPEKGRANQAVVRVLAEALGVDRRSISAVSGQTAARKEFRIQGASARELHATLSRL